MIGIGFWEEGTHPATYLPVSWLRVLWRKLHMDMSHPAATTPSGAESLTDLFVEREQKDWVRAWCRAPSRFGQAVTRGIASAFCRGWRWVHAFLLCVIRPLARQNCWGISLSVECVESEIPVLCKLKNSLGTTERLGKLEALAVLACSL